MSETRNPPLPAVAMARVMTMVFVAFWIGR
jgi:hypothetical protein